MQYEIHPLALAIPPMREDAYQKLKEDIAQNGIHQTILLFEEKILDGRYRYQAVMELGLEPTFEDYAGDDPLGYLFSVNFYRRDLTHTQRCVVAMQALAYQEQQGKERQRQAGKRTAQMKKEGITPSLEGEKSQPKKRAPQSRDLIGKTVGVSGTQISLTKKILTESPDLLDKMKNGEIELSDAKVLNAFKQEHPSLYPTVIERIAQFPELSVKGVMNAVRNEMISANNAALKDDSGRRYNVILADPPWSYGEQFSGNPINPIESHYPTMTIPELCAMGSEVKAITDDNAVLFLWTTSPHLQLAFQVIEAWGFTYKTSLIWMKNLHSMGRWASVRHEIMLICTKGSYPPPKVVFKNSEGVLEYDTFHMDPSVFPATALNAAQYHMTEEDYAKEFVWLDTVHEEDRTVHSRKPDYYYRLIERMYPHSTKLELFCRAPQPGWYVFGNQSDGDDLVKTPENRGWITSVFGRIGED